MNAQSVFVGIDFLPIPTHLPTYLTPIYPPDPNAVSRSCSLTSPHQQGSVTCKAAAKSDAKSPPPPIPPRTPSSAPAVLKSVNDDSAALDQPCPYPNVGMQPIYEYPPWDNDDLLHQGIPSAAAQTRGVEKGPPPVPASPRPYRPNSSPVPRVNGAPPSPLSKSVTNSRLSRTGEARPTAVQIFDFKDAYISEDVLPIDRETKINKSKASLVNHGSMKDGQHRGCSPDASPHEAALISPEHILERSPPPKPQVSSESKSQQLKTAIETEI